MRLHVTRSQSTKARLIGGPETMYWLRLRVDIPEIEAELLKKHRYSDYAFDLPENFAKLREQGQLEGPKRVTLQDLQNSTVFGCKFLASSFSGLPEAIVKEYRELLGIIRAREEWGGEETVSVEY